MYFGDSAAFQLSLVEFLAAVSRETKCIGATTAAGFTAI